MSTLEIMLICYIPTLILSAGGFIGLYFLLRNKKPLTIKIVLMSILIFALVIHFFKWLYPPYSTNNDLHLSTSWFINICGANIGLFPVFFLSKNKYIKDYMFYLGVLSGILAIVVPLEPIQKPDLLAEWVDVVRFYVHHNILWYVPLLMVLLKLHTLDYRRVWSVPCIFMGVLAFVIINQVFQSELGYIELRNDDLFNINYPNHSLIWGPPEELKKYIGWMCPNIFKTIWVGEHAGEHKYWPWFWLLVPCFVVLIPVAFAMSMIFDHKHFKEDIKNLITLIKNKKRGVKC